MAAVKCAPEEPLMKKDDPPGNGASNTPPGPTKLHSHRTLRVAATPGEVMEALLEAEEAALKI